MNTAICPKYAKPLQKVTQGRNSMLNAEQFDAARAGDWFCELCPKVVPAKQYSYFWDRDLAAPLPAAPAPTEQAPQPKLTLALPDYEKRRIVIASDEMIDGERVVCVAIDGAAEQAGELPPLPEWSKRDDLGVLVPSEIRTALRDYARAALAARQAPRESKAEQAALPSDFLMPEDAWNEYATRSGLLNEHGVAPRPATAQAAYFTYQAAWNCLHKAFSVYIAARQAPAEAPKDCNVQQLVNDLRDIALTFHGAQLYSRISDAVGQFLAARQVGAPDDAEEQQQPIEAYVAEDGVEHSHPQYGRGVFFTYNCCRELFATPVIAHDGAVERDAARYQWLRERTVAWNALLQPEWKTGDRLDAALDVAIAQEQAS